MAARKNNIGIASLTPEDKLKAAYYHLIGGLDQHLIAGMFFVNAGRVAEAVKDVRAAVGMKGPRAKEGGNE